MTFYEATQLSAWYRSADQELRSAFDTSHDRGSVTAMDRRFVLPSATSSLLAVNMHSRMIFARIICDKIGNCLCNEYWEHDRPNFLLTIIPKAGIIRTDLRGFDPAVITNRLRIVLRGQDFIGVVEPGYYASLPLQDRTIGTQVISWHVHALLWNTSISAVGTLIERLSKIEAFSAVVPKMSAVHARQVNNGELPIVVRYVLKPPSEAKRIQRYPFIKHGEVVHYADGSIKYYVKPLSSILQKSERLRLFHAMKHLTVDQLIVGGGEGRIIRANALDEFDRQVTRRMFA